MKNNALDLIERLNTEIDRLLQENSILKELINGEWVNCEDVQKALSIDFSTGLKRFEFSRTAEWNPAPLNGQNITTKFRLSPNKIIEDFVRKIKERQDVQCYTDSDGITYRYETVCVDDIDDLVKEMRKGNKNDTKTI